MKQRRNSADIKGTPIYILNTAGFVIVSSHKPDKKYRHKGQQRCSEAFLQNRGRDQDSLV